MMIGSNKTLPYVIVEDIIKQIINEEILPGEKIFSVREQAKLKKMNPQTVQKAYNILIEEDIIIPKVGSGNYLTMDIKRLEELKKEFIDGEIQKFLSTLKKYNIDEEFVIKQIKESYEQDRD